MKYALILALFLFSASSYAESLCADPSGCTLVSNSALQSQHDWDHIGVSFATQTFLYGFSRKALRMKQTDAIIFSFVGNMMLTTLYSVSNNQTSGALGHDMLMNALGSGLSIGTVLVFDF